MSQQTSIRGLVDFARKIRQTLTHGSNPQFTLQQSQRMLELVDKQLKREQLSHNDLNAASRRAYLYLRALGDEPSGQADSTTKAAPSRPASAQPPPSPGEKLPQLRFPGMQRHLEQLAAALSNASAAQADGVAEQISNYSQGLEATITQQGIAASQLSKQARAARAWFAWLSNPQRQQRYRQAATYLQTRLSELTQDAGLGQHAFSAQFRPVSGLYQLSQRGQAYELRLPTAMLTLPDSSLEQLASHALSLCQEKQQLINSMEAPAYQAALAELKALEGEQSSAGRGDVHDLDAALQRVRQQYFAPEQALPSISWSGRRSYRKLGHFDPIADAIVISSALDDAAVPQAALDFVVFHELLHKQHGAQWSDSGRARSHTAAFRRDEERYPDKDNIEKLLARLSTTQGQTKGRSKSQAKRRTKRRTSRV